MYIRVDILRERQYCFIVERVRVGQSVEITYENRLNDQKCNRSNALDTSFKRLT